jgi:hypothetical protein
MTDDIKNANANAVEKKHHAQITRMKYHTQLAKSPEDQVFLQKPRSKPH